jgi:hypothetical protein
MPVLFRFVERQICRHNLLSGRAISHAGRPTPQPASRRSRRRVAARSRAHGGGQQRESEQKQSLSAGTEEEAGQLQKIAARIRGRSPHQAGHAAWSTPWNLVRRDGPLCLTGSMRGLPGSRNHRSCSVERP